MIEITVMTIIQDYWAMVAWSGQNHKKSTYIKRKKHRDIKRKTICGEIGIRKEVRLQTRETHEVSREGNNN